MPQAIQDMWCCPRYSDDEGSSNICRFEALSHGFGICCLRFVPPLLTTTQGSLPAGGQPLPGGSLPTEFLLKVSVSYFPLHWAALGATEFDS